MEERKKGRWRKGRWRKGGKEEGGMEDGGKEERIQKEYNMNKLEAGVKAPAFSGKDQNGKSIKLSDYKGKKIALYFYPQDMTPTCTVQACNLRDNYSLLQANGIQVIGVSPDEIDSHKKFEERHQLPFPLLADTKHAIIEKYGVWGEKQLYGRHYMGLHRTTFLINEKGVIEKVFLKPKSKQHAEEIIAFWSSHS